MNDTCIYRIELRGQVDEREINMMSPIQVTVEPAGGGATPLTTCTDQAGLIGLLRHLHGLGFVVLAMTRVEASEKRRGGFIMRM